MPREYRHIKQYEKEIIELWEQGVTLRKIAERFGFTKEQVQEFKTRYNKKQQKLAAGISIKPKGRPRKDGTELPPSVQQLSKLNQLQYELAMKERHNYCGNVKFDLTENTPVDTPDITPVSVKNMYLIFG